MILYLDSCFQNTKIEHTPNINKEDLVLESQATGRNYLVLDIDEIL